MFKFQLILGLVFLITQQCCTNITPLTVYDDYDIAKMEAQKSGKNMFIIFDLWGAPVPYIDEKILSNNKLKTILSKYVVVRLKCDDRRIKIDKTTIGRFNTNIQLRLVKDAHYQPMFCIFDGNEHLLKPPLGYSKIEKVIEFAQNY